MLRVFTSFSGYDSQCLALNRLPIEYELVGWSEIDKNAIKAHNALFPQWADRNFGDISKIDWNQVPDFDLFTYSSPCQDFSQAGRQQGGEKGSGTRSSLLWECERAIEIKRPKYLLMENVSAFVSDKFIKLFNQWQLTLNRLGYKCWPQVLDAKDFGVPQHRERIFLVSILDQDRKFEFPKPFKLEKRIKDVLEKNVPERYYISEERLKGLQISTAKQENKGNGFAFEPKNKDDVGNSLTTCCGGGRKTDNFVKESKLWEDIKLEMVGKLDIKGDDYAKRIYSAEGIAPTQNAHSGGNLETKIAEPTQKSCLTCMYCEQRYYVDDKRYNPTCMAHGFDVEPNLTRNKNYFCEDWEGNEPFIAASRGMEPNVMSPKRTEYGKQIRKQYESHQVSGEQRKHIHRIEPLNTDGCATTITTAHHPENSDNQNVIGGGQPQFRIRKLTPRECFRLMDVNDEDIDKMMNAGISQTQLYRLAGNSIVVAVLEKIFDKMFINTDVTEWTLF